MRQVVPREKNSHGACRIGARPSVLFTQIEEMQNDAFSKLYVDVEGLEPRCRDFPNATQGPRAVRADRTDSAGRFGDSAAVVALPPPRKWGKF